MTQVILVDENDRQTGIMEKLEAHKKGLLHRAFSVFVINAEGKMLLHKRAADKYHSPGLWTNACCSHPAPEESVMGAANRRLQEEMGFSCDLTEVDSMKYFARFDSGLIEHEFDHLILGLYDGDLSPDPREVSDYGYFSIGEIDQKLRENKHEFTFWFRLAFPLIKTHLASQATVFSSIH
ncbi:MAG TPA: isopentenyl-diphosphate Delta-isomerase [Sphingobacteriaceae bacterium]